MESIYQLKKRKNEKVECQALEVYYVVAHIQPWFDLECGNFVRNEVELYH